MSISPNRPSSRAWPRSASHDKTLQLSCAHNLICCSAPSALWCFHHMMICACIECSPPYWLAPRPRLLGAADGRDSASRADILAGEHGLLANLRLQLYVRHMIICCMHRMKQRGRSALPFPSCRPMTFSTQSRKGYLAVPFPAKKTVIILYHYASKQRPYCAYMAAAHYRFLIR
jgi:hypothetical protein